MMLQVHVEEPSAENALRVILPLLMPEETYLEVINHQSKDRLLRNLPNRLQALATWIPPDMKVLVLVDRDGDDCHQLKAELEGIATAAGLVTKTSTTTGNFHLANRLAIEELEAWFFGDTEALHLAYPRISETIRHQRKYRDPDAITGGTWESLERLLKHHGYYSDRMPKIEVARNISTHMDPARNRSRSFQVFRNAVIDLTS
ncbi:DUF4276 family protein [bacterium]|nr:DUF4276 family protein [bacterium]